jgi:hypothetical protein
MTTQESDVVIDDVTLDDNTAESTACGHSQATSVANGHYCEACGEVLP